MTRVVTIIAMTCFLVVGAAAVSIFGRDAVPAARSEEVVSNKEAKKDRLITASFAMASLEPSKPADPQSSSNQSMPNLSEPLRQALASVGADAGLSRSVAPATAAPVTALPFAAPQTSSSQTPAASAMGMIPASLPPKPKLADKPAPQKTYALLSDVQIAGIKDRLKLSPDQESYWPGVESALRAVARKIHATRQADPRAANALIDPDSSEVQQLKSAAMPLLFQLREDQKREVRALARLIGLEKVAAQI